MSAAGRSRMGRSRIGRHGQVGHGGAARPRRRRKFSPGSAPRLTRCRAGWPPSSSNRSRQNPIATASRDFASAPPARPYGVDDAIVVQIVGALAGENGELKISVAVAERLTAVSASGSPTCGLGRLRRIRPDLTPESRRAPISLEIALQGIRMPADDEQAVRAPDRAPCAALRSHRVRRGRRLSACRAGRRRAVDVPEEEVSAIRRRAASLLAAAFSRARATEHRQGGRQHRIGSRTAGRERSRDRGCAGRIRGPDGCCRRRFPAG